MALKNVFNQAPSIEEELLYKQVLDEVNAGIMRDGIYAKALADSLGDEGKAKSLYIKYRVQSLIEEEKHKAELLGLKLTKDRKNAKLAQKRKEGADYEAFEYESPFLHLTFQVITFIVVAIFFLAGIGLLAWVFT
jgi:hypothetical protein